MDVQGVVIMVVTSKVDGGSKGQESQLLTNQTQPPRFLLRLLLLHTQTQDPKMLQPMLSLRTPSPP